MSIPVGVGRHQDSMSFLRVAPCPMSWRQQPPSGSCAARGLLVFQELQLKTGRAVQLLWQLSRAGCAAIPKHS